MVRVLLIRHGETDYSAQRRYCGFSDPPLNSRGVWQSRRLAARLKDLRIDRVISSDLERAHETARIVFRHNSVEKTADLREMNFGLFEGLTHEEIIKKYPKPYEEWINDLERVRTPNGEGLRDLSKRIEDRLSFILSQYRDKTVALVSHSGPIRIILCEALKLGIEMFWQTGQQFGALNVIEYAAGSPPAVVMRNDVSHLSCGEEVVL